MKTSYKHLTLEERHTIEYFLREQLKSIHKELGDEFESEVEEMKKKITSLAMSKEAKKEATKNDILKSNTEKELPKQLIEKEIKIKDDKDKSNKSKKTKNDKKKDKKEKPKQITLEAFF